MFRLNFQRLISLLCVVKTFEAEEEWVYTHSTPRCGKNELLPDRPDEMVHGQTAYVRSHQRQEKVPELYRVQPVAPVDSVPEQDRGTCTDVVPEDGQKESQEPLTQWPVD